MRGNAAHALKALRIQNYTQVLALLKAEQPGGKLLDIGCAHGWFIEAAKEVGYDAEGIEPDDRMRTWAQKAGHSVRAGFFPDVLAAEEKFDLITFNDVFEHLPDITESAQACLKHLNDDGLLVVNIPVTTAYSTASPVCCEVWVSRPPLNACGKRVFPLLMLAILTLQTLKTFFENQGFVQVADHALGSVQLNGLWERIYYDRNRNILYSFGVYLCVVLALPIIKLFPSDIHVHLYRAKDQQSV